MHVAYNVHAFYTQMLAHMHAFYIQMHLFHSGAPHIPSDQRSFGSWFLGLGILGIGGLVGWLVVDWLVGVGCWLLVVGRWSLVVGRWLLLLLLLRLLLLLLLAGG